MTTLYKGNEARKVKESKVDGYLQSGWTTTPRVSAVKADTLTALVKDTTSSKPTVTASAAVKSAEETVSNLDKEKQDGNISW
jgi:hypothetical protein